jgi:hypothetical protein
MVFVFDDEKEDDVVMVGGAYKEVKEQTKIDNDQKNSITVIKEKNTPSNKNRISDERLKKFVNLKLT